MQKPSHSYWLLQLASWACLCLTTLPQSSAEQVQGPESLQIGLEVTSSKIEDSTHTTQLFLTNRSETAIDPAQYRLVVLKTPDPAVKVYVKNKSGRIVELSLDKPINLASLIGAEALSTDEANVLTLTSGPSKDTSHLKLILSIKDAQGKTVSKPVAVTWRKKSPHDRLQNFNRRRPDRCCSFYNNGMLSISICLFSKS